MGGRGSGRSGGLGMLTVKCHEYHSVDLDWLRRKRCLRPGYSGKLTWSRGGTPTGNIDYRVEASGLRLIYKTRSHGGDWRDVDELVPFVQTRTNFGGGRRWFECLSCRTRCRILYGGAYFRCRRCHRLKYDTQYEPPFARAATRALKIRDRLGCRGGIGDPFPAKPKGMHWRTYERLQAQEERLQNAWALGIMTKWNLSDRGE
jgi:hypothetical protein